MSKSDDQLLADLAGVPDDTPFDVVSFILAVECGTWAEYLDTDDPTPDDIDAALIDGYQRLIDSGTIRSLQGAHQRAAASLIEGGFCTPAD